MPEQSASEADKWYWIGGRWIIFSSARQRWENEAGEGLTQPSQRDIDAGAGKGNESSSSKTQRSSDKKSTALPKKDKSGHASGAASGSSSSKQYVVRPGDAYIKQQAVSQGKATSKQSIQPPGNAYTRQEGDHHGSTYSQQHVGSPSNAYSNQQAATHDSQYFQQTAGSHGESYSKRPVARPENTTSKQQEASYGSSYAQNQGPPRSDPYFKQQTTQSGQQYSKQQVAPHDNSYSRQQAVPLGESYPKHQAVPPGDPYSKKPLAPLLESLTLEDPRKYTFTDEKSGVKSTVQTGPSSRLTAGELQEQGFVVHKGIVETRHQGKSAKSKPPRYKVSKQPEDFSVGRVIELRWAEPTSGATVVTHHNGDIGNTRMRRFVIIGAGRRYCAAIPILTYSGRGVVAPHLVKSHHTAIYTDEFPPQLLPGEQVNAVGREVPDGLRMPGIRVESNSPTFRLDPLSRLNYAKVYQIDQQSCEIFSFGTVARDSLRNLQYQFRLVQNQVHSSTQPIGPAPHASSSPAQPRSIPIAQPVAQPAGGSQAGSSREDQYSRAYHPRNDSVQMPETGSRIPGDLRRLSEEAYSIPLASSGTPSSANEWHSPATLAYRYGVDITSLTPQQYAALARMAPPDQFRYIMNVLATQNPARYARIREELHAGLEASQRQGNYPRRRGASSSSGSEP